MDLNDLPLPGDSEKLDRMLRAFSEVVSNMLAESDDSEQSTADPFHHELGLLGYDEQERQTIYMVMVMLTRIIGDNTVRVREDLESMPKPYQHKMRAMLGVGMLMGYIAGVLVGREEAAAEERPT